GRLPNAGAARSTLFCVAPAMPRFLRLLSHHTVQPPGNHSVRRAPPGSGQRQSLCKCLTGLAEMPLYPGNPDQYLALESLAGKLSSTASSCLSHLAGLSAWASLPALRTCTGASRGPGFLPSFMAA